MLMDVHTSKANNGLREENMAGMSEQMSTKHFILRDTQPDE